jgi:purine-cytosine permease-like protein
MPDLAVFLFAPWFLILVVLYWVYPRQPRHARRRAFDVAALLVAIAAFVVTLHWAHGYADRRSGTMCPQILATSAGYGVFLLVLVVAVFVRRAWLRRG